MVMLLHVHAARAVDARGWVVGVRPEYSPEEIAQGALDGYFTGAVFAGDSLTQQLRIYTADRRRDEADFLSDAAFLSAVNYSLFSASLKEPRAGKVNFIYRGAPRSLLQAVERLKPARLFILLGANDYAPERPDDAIEWYGTLIDRAAKLSPGTDLVVQSLPPVRPVFDGKNGYQAKWDAFNERLKALCAEKGVAFADIAAMLKGTDGFLQAQYSGEDGLHLNNRGILVWLDALRQNAHERYLNNEWTP